MMVLLHCLHHMSMSSTLLSCRARPRAPFAMYILLGCTGLRGFRDRYKTTTFVRMAAAKAYVVAVLIRLIYSGMHVMSKAALDAGMSPFVFLFYRQTLAAVVLIPATFVLERGKAPPLTFKIAGKIFIHALYGVTACGDLFNLGLNYASATSSSAVFNICPVVTFILAVIFGMESMNLKMFHGKTKAFGILLCVVGVAVLAFYQGPEFRSFNHHQLFQHGSSGSPGATTHSKKQWAFGIFLMTLSNVLSGLWTVLQRPMLKDYPSTLLNTTLQCVSASVQTFVVALLVERDFSQWKLGWNVSIVSIIYTGVVVSAVSYYLQIWTIGKMGPVFLAMSIPLTLIFTILISSFILGEAISLGSIVAGVLLIGGLYNVLWGKSIEQQDVKKQASGGKPCLELQGSEMAMQDQAAKV